MPAAMTIAIYHALTPEQRELFHEAVTTEASWTEEDVARLEVERAAYEQHMHEHGGES